MIFAGNSVLGRAGEGIIHCNGEKEKPSLIPLYLVSVSRCWQTAGAGSCLQHAALDRARHWRALWSCPTLGLCPTIVVPGLKCSWSYLKLTFVQTFVTWEVVRELHDVGVSCRHVPVMHLWDSWALGSSCSHNSCWCLQTQLPDESLQVCVCAVELLQSFWVPKPLSFVSRSSATQCELWWEEAAQHTSEGTAETWTYWFGSQKLELINVKNNGRNWVLRSTSNSFSRRVCQTLLLRGNTDFLAFSSRFLTVTRTKQEWCGKMRHVFWKNIQAD